MPQPIWATVPWLGSTRGSLKFGGKPLPLIGTTMNYIDLNDGVSWFVENIEVSRKKLFGVKPYSFQEESAWISEDSDTLSIRVTVRYDESGQVNTFYLPLINPSAEALGPNLTVFRSIGTDATGTLNAWTIDGGSPTIASNLVTIPNGAGLHAGHPDWDDGTFRIRVKWVTGSLPRFWAHWNDYTNGIFMQTDGTNWTAYKIVANTLTGLGSFGGALTNGNFYWAEIVIAGTTVTFNVYNDSAGAIGSFIASSTATIADAAIQKGAIHLDNIAATSAIFGGAFAGVCLVNCFVPVGWTVAQGTGEPAWCWSKSRFRSGARSFSIYNAHSSAQAWWQSTNIPTIAGVTYSVTAWAMGLTGSNPLNFYPLIGFVGAPPNNYTSDGVWRVQTLSGIPGANQPVELIAYGAGTFYYDDVTVSTLVATSSFAAAKAVLSQAGEQFLTTDDLTAIACRLVSIGSPTLIAGSVAPYVFKTSLEFLAVVFAQDIAQTIVPAIAVAGSSGAGTATAFSTAYLGSVRGKPIFTITIPAGNTATISQIKLQNTTTGRILTINFSPVLPASTAKVLTIDTGAYTVKDDLGNFYDPIGSMPLLAPPAGTINAWILTIISNIGTTGITMSYSYYNRWEF